MRQRTAGVAPAVPAVLAVLALLVPAVLPHVAAAPAPVADRSPGPTAYADPAPPAPARVAPAEPVAPLDQTFALHSRPTASTTIFVDVDGGTVSGTAWNTAKGLPAGHHPAWDPGHDGAGFSAAERGLVQEVWRRVAEDFAPFDVDVTTEDPGDLTGRGVRALVTPDEATMKRLCGSCSGTAFIDVLGRPTHGPAWVFANVLWDDASYVAETVSHEVGHNLGLRHDGGPSSAYYAGHGTWAPIMGAAYGHNVSQWSRGSYPGATNREDDVAILGDRLGFRPDEAGSDVATAAPHGDGAGVITTADDRDTFAVGPCGGPTTVVARPADTGPNLDVRLDLLDAAGAVVATARPSGLAASLTADLPVGRWFVRVDGDGKGDWDRQGYDDYGSLGAYRLTVTGCARVRAEPDPDDPGPDTGPDTGTGPEDDTDAEPEPAASRTRLSLPQRAVRGTRPTATVRVTGPSSPARGKVRIAVGGRRVATVRLVDGRARTRLPRLARVGRVRVVATFLGTTGLERSRAARTVRVVRR